MLKRLPAFDEIMLMCAFGFTFFCILGYKKPCSFSLSTFQHGTITRIRITYKKILLQKSVEFRMAINKK